MFDFLAQLPADPQSTTDPPPDFPLHTLPPTIRDYIASSSFHTRVPPEMIAFPFLALIGGIIGDRLRIQVSLNWFERPALWIALVSATGTGKSPAIRAARQPFEILQDEFLEASRPAPKLTMIEWMEKRIAENRNPKPRYIEPEPEPVPARVFTSHLATDDLALTLEYASGITILRDELIGLVRVFSRRGGDERQRYLSLWSSEPITAIRRDEPDLWIPSPVVSIVGGLQPALLQRLRSREQDGLLERFLPIHGENKQRYWSEIGLESHPVRDPEIVTDLIRPLAFLPNHPGGNIVQRTPEASLAWIGWFNDNVDRTAGATSTARGFYNKLPAHVSRFALILHALWHPDSPTDPISVDTMHRAIALGEVVRNHIHRTVSILGDDPTIGHPKPALSQAILRILAETREPEGWLSRNQLRIAVANPPLETFEPEIESLLNQNRIEFRKEPPTKRGRPRHLYRLLQ